MEIIPESQPQRVFAMAALHAVQAFAKLRDAHLLRIFADQAFSRGLARTPDGSRFYSTPPNNKEDHAPSASSPPPTSPTTSPTEGDWEEVVHQSGGIYWWNQRTGGIIMQELLLPWAVPRISGPDNSSMGRQGPGGAMTGG